MMVASTRSAEVKAAAPVEVQQERMARDLASSSQSHPGDLTTSTAGKGVFAESGPSKSPSTGIHKPTWKPTQGKPTEKPVEPWKEGSEGKEEKNTAHKSSEKVMSLLEIPAAAKAPKTATGPVLPLDIDVTDAAPAQPAGKGPAPAAPAAPATINAAPGTGYIARKAQVSWETNMIAEDAPAAASADAPAKQVKAPAGSAADGAAGGAKAPPADKAAGSAPAKTDAAPVAALYMTSGYKAASPTKSPSTGMHKPTWKPSSKPAEHRELQTDKAVPAPKTADASVAPNPKDDKALAAKALEKKGAETKGAAPAPKDGASAPVKTDGPVDVPAPGPVHVSTPTMTPLTSKKPAEHRELQSEKAAPAPKTGADASVAPNPKDDKALAAKALEKKGAETKGAAPAPKDGASAPVKTDGPVDVPAPGPVHVSTPTMTPLTSKKPAEHRRLSSTSKPNEKGKTSKPAEKKSSIGAALPRHLQAAPEEVAGAAAAPVRPTGTTKAASDKAPAALPPMSAGNPNPALAATAPVAALYMKSGYKAASPTKSPSTGMHKPTWRPSSKPAEHRSLRKFTEAEKALAAEVMAEEAKTAAKKEFVDLLEGVEDLTVEAKEANEAAEAAAKAAKKLAKEEAAASDATKASKVANNVELEEKLAKGLNMKELNYAKEQAASAGEKAIKATKAEIVTEKKALPLASAEEAVVIKADIKEEKQTLKTDKKSVKELQARRLSLTKKDAKIATYGSAPSKSPSTGKPQEAVETPKDAASPSKSPSTGMHKPTWRPSAKPVESSKKSSKGSVGAALPRSLKEKKSEKSAEKEEKSEKKSEKKSTGEEQVAPLTKPDGPVAPQAEIPALAIAKKSKSASAVEVEAVVAEAEAKAVPETTSKASKSKKADPVAVASLPEGVSSPAAGDLLLPPVKNSKLGQLEGEVVPRTEA